MKQILKANEPDCNAGPIQFQRPMLDNGNLNSRPSTEPPQTTGRSTDDSERLLVEQERPIGSPSSSAHRFDWEMFGIGSFLVFLFVGFFFALYVIWAKCNGNFPY